MSCDSTQLPTQALYYLYFYAGVCWSLGDAHCELQEVSMGAMLMPTCSCALCLNRCMYETAFIPHEALQVRERGEGIPRGGINNKIERQ